MLKKLNGILFFSEAQFMSFQKIEGFVLHSMHFQDYDQILKVFSQEMGCLKIIVKNGYRISQNQPCALTSLMKVSFLIEEGRGELYRCRAFTILDSYPKIRENLKQLQVACELLQILHFFQYPGVIAEPLYHLLVFFLEKLPEIAKPEILPTAFRLKIWKHEGILNMDFFSPEEQDVVFHLAHQCSLTALLSISLTDTLKAKIKKLFLEF